MRRPTRTPASGRGRDRAVAAVALDLHADRGDARDGGLDGVRGARASRVEPALEARAAGTPEPVLPSSRRRARARRRQEAGPVPSPRSSSAGSRARARVTAARAGKPSTSASMTPPDSPTSKSSPTNAAMTTVGFFERAVAWFAERGVTVRRSHERQRRALPLTRCGRRGVRRIGSSTSAPGPTGPAPTAKPNGSSKPCSANGPTPPRYRTSARIEPVHCPPGSTTTTTNDPTAPSATRHPPAGSTPTDQRPGIYTRGQHDLAEYLVGGENLVRPPAPSASDSGDDRRQRRRASARRRA